MGLFDKLKDPVFIKKETSALKQLEALKSLLPNIIEDQREELEKEIQLLEYGIKGEEQIAFELSHSHMPMYILHDVCLKQNDLSAQIDFIVITRWHNYVIECKNLYGDISIDNSGAFTRDLHFGKYHRKEGIYSPYTQNQRHFDLIKELFFDSKKPSILKFAAEKLNAFEGIYKNVIVLANPKTVLKAEKAPREIRDRIIRADQLISCIKKTDEDHTWGPSSDNDMKELAKAFLSLHKEPDCDYSSKYITSNPKIDKVIKCPKCGADMVIRKATKGDNAGKEFYGCSNFPKCHQTIDLNSPLLKDDYDYFR